MYTSMSTSISDRELPEQDIQNYIKMNLPGISYEDMWKIRGQFIYDFIPLEVAVERYWREQLFKKWSKSKNKEYYSVPMLNGGRKIVYMCEEQVEFLYKDKDYRKVG